MKTLNLDNVTEESNSKPTAGGYVLQVADVHDVPLNPATGKGDYLTIDYDFAEGEFKSYYYNLYIAFNFWGGHFIRSYKPKALGMFKAFVNELEKDNDGYKWNNDEKEMIGRKFGAVLAEEEYRGNDGSIKTRLVVSKITSIKNIHDGNFTVPETKRLATASSVSVVDTTADSMEKVNEDVPF